MKKYYFKTSENVYYGVVYCLDVPIVLNTREPREAIIHYENEIDKVVSLLLGQNIFADPTEIE